MRLDPLIIGEHRLPYRRIFINGEALWIPRHVYRKKDRWEVRINRKDEKLSLYHTDHDHGIYGALERCLETLYDEMPKYTVHECLHPGSSHYYQVRDYRCKNHNVMTTYVQTYICAYNLKLRNVTFYVGTENTKTEDRLKRAVDRAVGTRCWSIDTIKSEGRDILFGTPIPKNIERYAY